MFSLKRAAWAIARSRLAASPCCVDCMCGQTGCPSVDNLQVVECCICLSACARSFYLYNTLGLSQRKLKLLCDEEFPAEAGLSMQFITIPHATRLRLDWLRDEIHYVQQNHQNVRKILFGLLCDTSHQAFPYPELCKRKGANRRKTRFTWRSHRQHRQGSQPD